MPLSVSKISSYIKSSKPYSYVKSSKDKILTRIKGGLEIDDFSRASFEKLAEKNPKKFAAVSAGAGAGGTVLFLLTLYALKMALMLTLNALGLN